MDQFLQGLGASLLAAAIAASLGYLLRGIRYRQRVECAPRQYVERLEELLRRAIEEGTRNAILNSRAIVAVRDDLRRSMVSLAGLLNGEIDQLARQLEISTRQDFMLQEAIEYYSREHERAEPAPIQVQTRADQLFETIQVLWRKWPSKRAQMEVEIRKLLAELGLDRA